MDIVEIAVEEITIGANRRPTRDIAKFAQSILLSGLQNPIVIDENKLLISGRHRLEAFRMLGYRTIPAVIRKADELKSQLAEIDENLIRNELPALEKGEALVQRDAILLSLGQRADVVNKGFNGKYEKVDEVTGVIIPPVITTADIAAEIGVSESTTQKYKQVAREIVEDVKEEIRGTVVGDSITDLLKLARQQPPRQRAIVAKLQEKTPDGEPVAANVHHALNLVLQDERDTLALQKARRRPPVTQADALDWLCEQPPCDLLLTDPPYSTEVDEIELFAAQWLPLALSKVKETGRAFICIGAYPAEIEAYLNATHLTGCPLLCEQVLVWTYRNTLGPSPQHDYKHNWQAILYFRGAEAPPLDCPLMTEQFSVQDINAPDGRIGTRYHAWQKPDELAERLIRHSTKPGDLVLDPFTGTGTFLLAASRLGRLALGCDRSPEMIAIAEKRGCHHVR